MVDLHFNVFWFILITHERKVVMKSLLKLKDKYMGDIEKTHEEQRQLGYNPLQSLYYVMSILAFEKVLAKKEKEVVIEGPKTLEIPKVPETPEEPEKPKEPEVPKVPEKPKASKPKAAPKKK